MGEIFFKQSFVLFVLVYGLVLFSVGVFSAVHPLYSGFSSPEYGFLYNNVSGVVSVVDTAVYRVGYFSVNGSAWQNFNLSGIAYNGNANWLSGSSLYTLPFFGVGEHYVVVYSCGYVNSSWDCHDDKWQLIVVNNSVSAGLNGTILNCSGADTRVCNISNGVGVQAMTCNTSTGVYGFPYGVCVLTGCNSGYVPSGNSCVLSSSGSCGVGEYLFNGVCLLNVSGNTYFVATNGSDSNPGTFSQPWKTWQKAFNTADAGDIVYFRGGIWYPKESLIIAPRELEGEWGGPYYGNMGTAENPIRYYNYPGENPILDGRDRTPEDYPSMMFFFGAAYVEFKGITVRNVPQYPTSWMAVGIGCSCCSNFKFENMVVHDIGGRGYSWFSCMGYHGITEDTNIWINCDTYNCKDPYSPEPGNGGDCFKTVNEAGAYSIFHGCRAWNCSDDGYDLSGPNTVIVNNSWSFLNGFPGALDGNGFKSGGVNVEVSDPTRIITNNIAANNTGYGYFDLEYDDLYRNNARVYNNLFYSSGTGILISDNPHYDRTLSIYRNNIIYIAHNLDSTSRPYIIDAPFYYTESNNNWDMVDMGSSSWWDYADDVTVSDEDFVSLDVYQLARPRKPDWSLPDVDFGHLAPGSDLIDAGTQIPPEDGVDILLQYLGSAPDLGPFEYS